MYFLSSVNLIIDANELYLYAQDYKQGFIKWKHLSEISENFYNLLNENDYKFIENLKKQTK
jgi:hypothetical protein